MLRVPNVLLLCGTDEESAEVGRALIQAANLTPIRSLIELRERAEQASYDALFCGSSFHRTRWKDAVEVIRIILGDVPVVFLSGSEATNEWKEALGAGGFDLLAPPYNRPQTLAVLGQAVESYQARAGYDGGLQGTAQAN